MLKQYAGSVYFRKKKFKNSYNYQQGQMIFKKRRTCFIPQNRLEIMYYPTNRPVVKLKLLSHTVLKNTVLQGYDFQGCKDTKG